MVLPQLDLPHFVPLSEQRWRSEWEWGDEKGEARRRGRRGNWLVCKTNEKDVISIQLKRNKEYISKYASILY